MVNMYICKDDKAYEKELNIWATFYMTFNDDNARKCDNSLHNAIAVGELEETAESIRAANYKWFQDIKGMGVAVKEIIEWMPEAREYCGKDDLPLF